MYYGGRENKTGAYYTPEEEQSGFIHTFQGRPQRNNTATIQRATRRVVALWGKSTKKQPHSSSAEHSYNYTYSWEREGEFILSHRHRRPTFLSA